MDLFTETENFTYASSWNWLKSRYRHKNSSKIKVKMYWKSGPQDQKSVIFSHSVISLDQLLKNSKTGKYFLNLQKLCQNIPLSEYYA